MPLKLINATELRPGSCAIIDNTPCIVKNIDISKTGKHGHAKARIEAIGLLDNKKHITVMPGSERLSVPMIEKKRAQVLSINTDERTASLMDVETFETLEVKIFEELLETIKENINVEYWDIEGVKIIKRVI